MVMVRRKPADFGDGLGMWGLGGGVQVSRSLQASPLPGPDPAHVAAPENGVIALLRRLGQCLGKCVIGERWALCMPVAGSRIIATERTPSLHPELWARCLWGTLSMWHRLSL